jgi:cysteine desulfurase/selenocysteine lyase
MNDVLAPAPAPVRFDVDAIRAQFPILRETVRGKKLVFLDSAASAQKPRAVIDAMVGSMEHHYANVHRGLHWMSERATEAYESCRDAAQTLLNAPARETIVITRNTTEAINLVAHSYGSLLKPGDAVLISAMEHHSNIVPWQMLRDRAGIELRVAPITDAGELDWPAFESLLADGRVRLVAITHMSNVLGTVTPAARIIAAAHAAGARVMLDGSQAVVHRRIDVAALDVDFYVWTGHKLYGPTGIGILYGKPELLEAMPPFLGGGDMISSVTFEASRWAAVPHKFEAGTPPILEGIGLKAAIDWFMALDMAAMEAHERALTEHAIARLAAIPGVRVLGAARARRGNLAGPRRHRGARGPPLRRTADAPLRHRELGPRVLRRLHHDRRDRLAGRHAGPGAELLRVTADTMFDDVRDLYQQVILDHGRHPRNHRRLEAFDGTAEGDNPMCGDRIAVWVRHDGDGRLNEVTFQARGCAICIASGSLMTELCQGHAPDEIAALSRAARQLARSGAAPEADGWLAEALDRLAPLAGVAAFPSRVKCATLAWHTLEAALDPGQGADGGRVSTE